MRVRHYKPWLRSTARVGGRVPIDASMASESESVFDELNGLLKTDFFSGLVEAATTLRRRGTALFRANGAPVRS